MRYGNDSPLTVAVGSRNRAKLAAVTETFGRVWTAVTVEPVSVPPGVSAMPFGDAECILGARQRAQRARERLDADFGVGLEGGVSEEPSGLMLLGWVVIVDRTLREGVACTVKTALPPTIAQRVRAGEELGPLIDRVTGEHNLRAKGGAAALISAGLVTRQAKFAQAVAYALSPFVSPELFDSQR